MEKNFDYGDESLDYCVYAHVNKTNGKIYIGVTNDINRRWRESDYRDCCPAFYCAIQKYGWNGFEHIVLIDGITRIMAWECEKELIKKYHTMISEGNGYNMTPGGSGGRTQYGENSTNSKPIFAYDLDGNFYKSWGSLMDASRDTGVQSSSITWCAQGKLPRAGLYQWRYEHYTSIPKYEKTRGRNAIKYLKPVYKIDPSNGAIVEIFDNIYATNYKGVKLSGVMNSCLRKCNTSYGYIWMFEENYSKEYVQEIIKSMKKISYGNEIYQYSISTGLLIKKYPSITIAAQELGLHRTTITKAASKRHSTHKASGYIWLYGYDCNYGQAKLYDNEDNVA